MRYLLILLISLYTALPVYNQSYHAVPYIKTPPLFNERLGHISALMNNPNAQVRILIYGQSISVQDWWKDVKVYFEKKYPSATISFINKAIGGFSAERLKLTVANDIISFYPDLILFHDYGNEEDYEKIIRIIRTVTTADIAIQTDHMAQQNAEWHDRHNNVWLPGLCDKYGLALIDVRRYWKQYLQENKLGINDLLTDGIHLNDHGNYLMSSIIKKYFDNLAYLAVSDNRVKYLKRGKDFSAKSDSIVLPFTGNRIEFVSDASANTIPVMIMIDNKSLRSNQRCYYYTQPSLNPDNFFPTNIGLPLAMELSNKVQEEKWFLTILSVDSVQQHIEYSLKGSHSGDDGTGNSTKLFTSNSGKITIRPDAWFLRKSKNDFAQFNWVKPGDILKWETKRMCFDSLVLQPSTRQTVLQGIENTTHHIKIFGPGVKHIKEIVVCTPLLKED